MPGCPQHTKAILFLWGFDHDGNPYMDARMVAENTKEAGKLLHGLNLRSRFHAQLKWAMFHVSKETTIEEVEQYISSAKEDCLRRDIINKLTAATIRLQDITRVESEVSSINFILSLENDDDKCTCGHCEEEDE